MPPDEVEDAIGEEVGADVEVTGVAGAQGEGLGREAVLGHVRVGGGKEETLDFVKGAWGWGMVVGVEGSGVRTGDGPQGAEVMLSCCL